ncbi:MAG TPA: hypothetical protein VE999_12600, partial [Gemmataceae bacterium]|nr:hypothetical protein [Gemmataceae bacterium]
MFSYKSLFQVGYVLQLLLSIIWLSWPSMSNGQFRHNKLPPPPAMPPLSNLNTDSTGNFIFTTGGLAGGNNGGLGGGFGGGLGGGGFNGLGGGFGGG